MHQIFVSANIVSLGLTRYANAAISGQGLLFKVTIQTKITLPNLAITAVTTYVDAANNHAGATLVVQDAPENNLTIINNLGTNTVKSDEFIRYSNPASDVIYLVVGSNSTPTNNLKLSVYNILGQSVEELTIKTTPKNSLLKNGKQWECILSKSLIKITQYQSQKK